MIGARWLVALDTKYHFRFTLLWYSKLEFLDRETTASDFRLDAYNSSCFLFLTEHMNEPIENDKIGKKLTIIFESRLQIRKLSVQQKPFGY